MSDARDKADEGHAELLIGKDRTSGSDRTRLAVAKERDEADDILEAERAMADESLRREREDAARVLSALLPLARNRTDRRLVTERATSDAALECRDDFLAIVSHDLNNLVFSIALDAGILARKCADTPEGRLIAQGATRIQLCTARMKRLISDLTDVTSLDAGHLAINRRPRDARQLVAEVTDSFRQMAVEKQIILEVESPATSLGIVCDSGRILQVLVNLVGNAVKFTPAGGKVTLRVWRDADEMHFSVIDTGIGIPDNVLEEVFERFWQVRQNDRRGMGLGLYIARAIVDAHGGRIWVESQLGIGSAFHFTVPAPVSTEAATRRNVG